MLPQNTYFCDWSIPNDCARHRSLLTTGLPQDVRDGISNMTLLAPSRARRLLKGKGSRLPEDFYIRVYRVDPWAQPTLMGPDGSTTRFPQAWLSPTAATTTTGRTFRESLLGHPSSAWQTAQQSTTVGQSTGADQQTSDMPNVRLMFHFGYQKSCTVQTDLQTAIDALDTFCQGDIAKPWQTLQHALATQGMDAEWPVIQQPTGMSITAEPLDSKGFLGTVKNILK